MLKIIIGFIVLRILIKGSKTKAKAKWYLALCKFMRKAATVIAITITTIIISSIFIMLLTGMNDVSANWNNLTDYAKQGIIKAIMMPVSMIIVSVICIISTNAKKKIKKSKSTVLAEQYNSKTNTWEIANNCKIVK